MLGPLATGHSNREIAEQLVVSVRTVGRHVDNLYGKIGVHERGQARQYARDHGLTAPLPGSGGQPQAPHAHAVPFLTRPQTVREMKVTEHFACSMSAADAMAPENLLCYEMNGAPLPPEHGFLLRLIAPGWYGVTNVKWLSRIEVRDSRFQGKYMARDYVTIREEQQAGERVWTEQSHPTC